MTVTKTKKTRAQREALMAQAHEELMAAYRGLIESDGWLAYLEKMALLLNYSAGNVLRILTARPSATRVASIGTWNRLGRRVRKGEKGIPIIVPMRFRVEAKLADGSVRQDQELRGFRIGHCWDISQTEGEPLSDLAEPVVATGDAPEQVWNGIVELIEAEGFSVSVAPLDGANGETRWHSRQVIISDRLVGRGRCKTALHELAHCQLHRYDPSALATKEVEAESVAWLCVRYLLGEASADEVLGYTGPYLASWSQGDPALVEATAVKVRASALHILDSFEALSKPA